MDLYIISSWSIRIKSTMRNFSRFNGICLMGSTESSTIQNMWQVSEKKNPCKCFRI